MQMLNSIKRPCWRRYLTQHTWLKTWTVNSFQLVFLSRVESMFQSWKRGKRRRREKRDNRRKKINGWERNAVMRNSGNSSERMRTWEFLSKYRSLQTITHTHSSILHSTLPLKETLCMFKKKKNYICKSFSNNPSQKIAYIKVIWLSILKEIVHRKILIMTFDLTYDVRSSSFLLYRNPSTFFFQTSCFRLLNRHRCFVLLCCLCFRIHQFSPKLTLHLRHSSYAIRPHTLLHTSLQKPF